MVATERLLTVDEFLMLPDWDTPTELLDGKIVEYPPHGALHGYTTAKISYFLGTYQHERRSGFALSCAPAIILSHEPARVRCPDVCFITAERLPAGARPYFLGVVPELIVEVVDVYDLAYDVRSKTTSGCGPGLVSSSRSTLFRAS